MRLEREKAEKRQRNIITAIIVVVVVALIGVAWWAIDYQMSQNQTPDETPASVTADNGVLITPEDLGGESDENTVEVVIWEDLSCPGCQGFFLQSADYLDEIIADGQASIEFRFANFLDASSPNSYSTRGAAAAVCVFEEDGPETFKDFQTMTYMQQPQQGTQGPEDDELADLATQAGASDAAAECIENGDFQNWIGDTADAFGDSGLTSTPGIIIDGQILEADPSPEAIQAALDEVRGVSGDEGADEATDEEAEGQ